MLWTAAVCVWIWKPYIDGQQSLEWCWHQRPSAKTRPWHRNIDMSGMYLNKGHIPVPLSFFWAAADVAPSTRSLRKWKSFSDSMHCFLHQWVQVNARSSTQWRRSDGRMHSHVSHRHGAAELWLSYQTRFGEKRLQEHLQRSSWWLQMRTLKLNQTFQNRKTLQTTWSGWRSFKTWKERHIWLKNQHVFVFDLSILFESHNIFNFECQKDIFQQIQNITFLFKFTDLNLFFQNSLI